MIIELRDNKGFKLGATHIVENNINGVIEILNLDNLKFIEEIIDSNTNEKRIIFQMIEDL